MSKTTTPPTRFSKSDEREFWEGAFLSALAALANKKNAAQRAGELADQALAELRCRVPEPVSTQEQLNLTPRSAR